VNEIVAFWFLVRSFPGTLPKLRSKYQEAKAKAKALTQQASFELK